METENKALNLPTHGHEGEDSEVDSPEAVTPSLRRRGAERVRKTLSIITSIESGRWPGYFWDLLNQQAEAEILSRIPGGDTANKKECPCMFLK